MAANRRFIAPDEALDIVREELEGLQARLDHYTRELAAGRMTVDQIRAAEGLPPLTEQTNGISHP